MANHLTFTLDSNNRGRNSHQFPISTRWTNLIHTEFAARQIIPLLYVYQNILVINKEWNSTAKKMFPSELGNLMSFFRNHEGIVSHNDMIFLRKQLSLFVIHLLENHSFYTTPANKISALHLISTLVHNACIQRAPNNLSAEMSSLFQHAVRVAVRHQRAPTRALLLDMREDNDKAFGHWRWKQVESIQPLMNILSSVSDADRAIRQLFSTRKSRSLGGCFQYLDRYYHRHNMVDMLDDMLPEIFSHDDDEDNEFVTDVRTFVDKCLAQNPKALAADKKLAGRLANSRASMALLVGLEEGSKIEQCLSCFVHEDEASNDDDDDEVALNDEDDEDEDEVVVASKDKQEDDQQQPPLPTKHEHVRLLFTNHDASDSSDSSDTTTMMLPATHPMFQKSTYLHGLGLHQGDVSRFDLRGVCDIKLPVFMSALRFIEHHDVHGPMRKIEKPLLSANMADVVDEFDATFVDELGHGNQEMLFDMIVAANQLGLSDLLDLCSAKVASQIKGKTPEQIRQTFNIQPMDPVEEAQLQAENAWMDDD